MIWQKRLKSLKLVQRKVIGRKLAARVLNTWHEDFVDEDTGEVVSIERNEIVIDRDTILEKITLTKYLRQELKLYYFTK